MKDNRNSYKYFHIGLKTIAVGKYKGKTVKASAKLDPRDEYDEKMGEEIAGTRLYLKILEKRRKNNDAKIANLKAIAKKITDKLYYHIGYEQMLCDEIDKIEEELEKKTRK